MGIPSSFSFLVKVNKIKLFCHAVRNAKNKYSFTKTWSCSDCDLEPTYNQNCCCAQLVKRTI